MSKQRELEDLGYQVNCFLHPSFDSAIVGAIPRNHLVCYDYYKLIDILVSNGQTHDEAESNVEDLEMNTVGQVAILHTLKEASK